MRYLILLFLFFTYWGTSYEVLSAEKLLIKKNEVGFVSSTQNSSLILLNPSKKPQKRVDRKKSKQLKKQTQTLKWQLLKNALKAQKTNKKLDKQNKKDKKPVYWASWLSALSGIIAYALSGISNGGAYFGAFILAMPLGIVALVLAIKSLRFIKRNPKKENNSYNRTWSIIFTVIGMYIGVSFLIALMFLLLFFSFIIA